MTREEAIKRIKYHKIVHKMDEPRAVYISEALDMATRSLETWDEVLKDVQDWQDDFNTHVKLLALTDAEKEATMMYGEDVVNIIGNHMIELKEVKE